MNFKRIAVIVSMDILLLTELTYSIYLGHQQPDAVAWIVIKTFVPLAIATVLAARLVLRRVGGLMEAPVPILDQDPMAPLAPQTTTEGLER